MHAKPYMSRPAIEKGAPVRRSRYAPWRAATLGLVYLFMAVHVVHWLIAGKTLAPLELNEVMYTVELGIVTAGFLFMAVAVLATSIFGRFFCSWGCHILALQDLCGWLLGRLRIRPKGVRSRLLLWVPVFVALYMFAWPQIIRLWEGRPLPGLHLASDAEGWASFTTEQFWRNLPGPGVALTTFAVCGFGIVYVLGSRAFCSYGCPYGAVFGMVDRIAPGRIRVGDDCTQCGTCTSVCTSHVRVHEELNRYGMVVNPSCMKDLDCVGACPQQSLHYGFGRPSLIRRVAHDTAVRRQYDFALWEEILMAAVFLAVLVIYRGLYDIVPFFLSIALAVMFAYVTIVAVRLIRLEQVTLNRWQLKRANRLMTTGRLFAAVMACFALLTIHSAVVRYHALQGQRYFHLGAGRTGNAADAVAARAQHHLEALDRWGLVKTERTANSLAALYVRRQNWLEAERQLLRVIADNPGDVSARGKLAHVLARQGRASDALRQYEAALKLAPDRPETHYSLAGLHHEEGRPDDARRHLQEAVRLRPDYAEAHYDLGAILVETGALEPGIDQLQQAIALSPDFAEARYNLSVALAMAGQSAAASREIDRAVALKPDDPQLQAFRKHLTSLMHASAPSAGSPTGD